MSTSKKPLGKRKRQSPPPSSTTSHISRRLEKLRNGKRNLWDVDNDHEEEEVEQNIPPKSKSKTPTDDTYIVLTDSGDEKTSSKQRSRSHKSKKKSSRHQDENIPSDTDARMASRCPTCLICSILSALSLYNCCPNHLSLLKYNQNSHEHHQQCTTNWDQWPPKQVMIVPVTDELIQRYLNPQEMYRLRTQTSTSPVYKKSKESTRQLSKKSPMTSEACIPEQTNVPKSKSSAKSPQMEMEEISSSSSIIDSSHPDRGPIPPDATFTIVSSTSTSTTSSSFESPTILNTGQLQQSSDQPIMIDDSQPDSHQEKKKQNDPWTPISDETYAAIETALEQVDRTSQEQMEFTPALARRTPTEQMASRLPKIQLKKGRYHRGKPIPDKSIPAPTADESSSTSLTPVIITRPPSSLATIVEDESLVIQPTRENAEKSSQSCQILSEGLSDTVMSCLFAQDESSQHDIIHTITKPIPNEALPALATIIEECGRENESHKSADISESSQLTNDHDDTLPLISSTTSEKPTTPARISYRLNPDGSRVSLSRPPLSAHQQSPMLPSRRTSTDTTYINK